MDSQNNSETSIKSIERIREYPIVKDSFTKASEYYSWIKEKSSTLNSTLTWTEGNLKTVIDMVEPMAATRLGSVDNFACNQLDKLETKYPIIKDSSENIIISSNQYYDNSIKPQVDKLVAAKDSAVYVAKTPFRITSNSIDFLSKTTNNFVNRYMSNNKKDTSDTINKKEYDILFGRALKELETIRYYSNKSIEGMTNVLSSIYDQSVTKNQEWINKYYQEYTDEIKNHSEDVTKKDLTVMDIATLFSNKMRMSVRAMSTVCYNHMTEANKEKMDLVFNKTEHIYTTLSKSTYSDIQEQITIDNVKWIGLSTVGLLANIKDALTSKYKQDIGESPNVEIKSDNDGDNIEEDNSECLSTNQDEK